MFRLLGFLIGSTISIAIILLVTGIPEFHVEDPEIDQTRFDEAVEKLMARKLDADKTPLPGRQGETNSRGVEESETAVTLPEPLRHESAAADRQPPLATTDVTTEPLQSAAGWSPPRPLTAAELHWYSFWNPFRSEIAANGFVSQLENVTGLDYRVVKVKTGVYEVAFAYVDDEERRRKLAQIVTATGLDLPDS